MFFGFLSRALAVAGLAGFLVGAYLYIKERADKRGLVVEDAERVVAEVLAGHDYVVEFRIHNPHNYPVRLLGAEYT